MTSRPVPRSLQFRPVPQAGPTDRAAPWEICILHSHEVSIMSAASHITAIVMRATFYRSTSIGLIRRLLVEHEVTITIAVLQRLTHFEAI